MKWLVLFLLSATAHAAGAKFALVVGANGAPPGRPVLHHAYDDARALSQVLLELGGFRPEEVVLLFDPPPAKIREVLLRAEGALKSSTDALLVVYYSGHADGSALYPNGEAFPLAELRESLQRVPAAVRIGIVDACDGGGWTGAKGARVTAPFAVQLPEALSTEGLALIASSSGLEESHEVQALQGSFFTHHLVASAKEDRQALTAPGRSWVTVKVRSPQCNPSATPASGSAAARHASRAVSAGSARTSAA